MTSTSDLDEGLGVEINSEQRVPVSQPKAFPVDMPELIIRIQRENILPLLTSRKNMGSNGITAQDSSHAVDNSTSSSATASLTETTKVMEADGQSKTPPVIDQVFGDIQEDLGEFLPLCEFGRSNPGQGSPQPELAEDLSAAQQIESPNTSTKYDMTRGNQVDEQRELGTPVYSSDGIRLIPCGITENLEGVKLHHIDGVVTSVDEGVLMVCKFIDNPEEKKVIRLSEAERVLKHQLRYFSYKSKIRERGEEDDDVICLD